MIRFRWRKQEEDQPSFGRSQLDWICLSHLGRMNRRYCSIALTDGTRQPCHPILGWEIGGSLTPLAQIRKAPASSWPPPGVSILSRNVKPPPTSLERCEARSHLPELLGVAIAYEGRRLAVKLILEAHAESISATRQ